MQTTRVSLLERIKGTSSDRAWEEFYAAYWAVIIRYAQKLGLSEAASNDVLQETMMTLIGILPGFKYDPIRGKFRNFLLTIAHRKALAAIRRAARHREVSLDEPSGPGDTPAIEKLAATDSDSLTREDEARWRESLFEETLNRLRDDPSIKPETFAVFKAYVIENRDADAVAKEFGIKKNAVYQIKDRLIRRLKADIEEMMEEKTAAGS